MWLVAAVPPGQGRAKQFRQEVGLCQVWICPNCVALGASGDDHKAWPGPDTSIYNWL